MGTARLVTPSRSGLPTRAGRLRSRRPSPLSVRLPVRLPLSRRALVSIPAAGLLLIGIVVAVPAAAVAPYTATGSVERISSGFTSVTRVDFVNSCPALPETQGQDGFVFQLPEPA